ncbi:DUF805 domain-containing protein [Sphingomonas sp. LB2R24]|uniref:DUF805 domain-containing protein n=1 Tax=Sphingomonas sorbitolis TaxID=3096165 RepID=UPI002FC9C02F
MPTIAPAKTRKGSTMPLRQFARVNGRLRRRAFWPFAATAVALVLVTSIILPPLGGLLGLVLAVPIATPAVRRFHDVGLSGFWLLPLLVLPIVLIGIVLFSISIFSLVLAAVIDSSLSQGQVGDVFHNIEIVLASAFGGWLMLCLIALLWRGSKGTNRFGDNPRPARKPT